MMGSTIDGGPSKDESSGVLPTYRIAQTAVIRLRIKGLDPVRNKNLNM